MVSVPVQHPSYVIPFFKCLCSCITKEEEECWLRK